MAVMKSIVVANVVALAGLVAGHGHPTEIIAEGVSYPANQPSWSEMSTTPFADQTVWDIGPLTVWGNFLTKDKVNDPDIICHVNARPVPGVTKVTAGNQVTIKYATSWPDSHWGPILTYLANCNGPCSQADKTQLEWFKIFEEGMLEDSKSPVNGQYIPGRWATDVFMANGRSSSITIPMVAPGNYLMRYELIALHQASQAEGPQFYPYCINLEVSGSGTLRPSGVKGTQLYNANDPSLSVDIYNPMGSYTIPGPRLFDGSSSLATRDSPDATAPPATNTTGSLDQPSGSSVIQNSTSSSNETSTATGDGRSARFRNRAGRTSRVRGSARSSSQRSG